MSSTALSRRAAHDDRLKVELRGEIPREIADVLDAVSMAKRSNRMELVIEILEKWADDQVHVATLVMRITGVDGSHRTGPGA